MTLIVEDGSGLTTAESYASVADANSYHASIGNLIWEDMEVDAKEQCLRRATQYMVEYYRGRWSGFRSRAMQALDWPRRDVFISDSLSGYLVPLNAVPPEVVRACCELALRAAAAPLADDLERGVLQETVGSVSVTYDKATAQYTRYRVVDMMLRPYLRSFGCSVPVVRT